MSEITTAEQALIEEFSLFDNWMDRYQYLIDMGRHLPPFPEQYRDDAHKIKGCQSQVWFASHIENERLQFAAISDAAIVSGLIALLLRIYNGRRPRDIINAKPDFVEALGLSEHLSPTRSNGLDAMLNTIRATAVDALADTVP